MRDRLLPVLMAAIMAATSPALAGDLNPSRAASGHQVASAARGDGTVTAAILPGIGREARVAPLPKPLSAADAETYARIFKLQAAGQWAAAEREMGHIKDDLLKGHVLAQRYLQSGAKPKYQELRAWMADYAELPQAEAIYKLATTKGVKGFGALKPPVKGGLRGVGIDNSDDGANWEELSFSADRGNPKGRALKIKFRTLLKKGDGAAALSLLTGPDARALDRLEIDELKVIMATDHFAGGRDSEAAAWAGQAAERSGDELPAAHWVAGLAQWRQGKPELAHRHFEEIANSETASSWMVAAGAFWAARSNLVAKRPEVVNHWLEVAATYPRTFYGLLARQTLGYETLFAWETPPFTEADADVLMRVQGAKRALGLLQLGMNAAAEEELRKAYPRATKPVKQSMMVLAHTGDMPGLSVRLGGMAPGMTSDAASYPVPDWTPTGGWTIDKALVFAFVRQESAFNPKAKSPAGAAGLMQLMPRTAQTMAGGRAVKDSLSDPQLNLALGQKYLAKLMAEEPVNGNLLLLAAAYNAGPGKLSQWLGGMKHNNDPLLFIEALPSRETRAFVERVMSNYWIYRSRLGQSSPSLDSVAFGTWPLYEGADLAARRKGAKS
ncbi:Lytic transglycosylase, catalytic [Magnetospirillum sp. LM-5]|uniref:lytic transglycosylase domain-containing protein n=1 Tax=Magnetospirillum sp. LM-5 TaxID=2681466 RepID=UPI001382AF88|nr:lytic transglycosylase domain-containing protein [Magnetospirillum sp. LM-5]CAA7614759.1 Lytic transglycosylase, catalytic [Magnetospirillum sp. LM-5]